MYEYAFRQWLVFFYFYCIVGWIYESIEVSIRTKKWTNRGFMKGPWLPLYGSGAIVILFFAIPFRKWVVAVFFAGMISATILEYFTGVAMVKLFKVRYWDYSYRKIQLNGHICLAASLVWGIFSLAMVYVIHPFVEKLIYAIPGEIVSVMTFIITVLFVYDFTNAFRDAMDLRTMIIQMEQLKELLDTSLEIKYEELEKNIAEKREEIKHSIEERKLNVDWTIAERKELYRKEIENRMEALRNNMDKHTSSLLRRNPTADFTSLKEESERIKERLRTYRTRNKVK